MSGTSESTKQMKPTFYTVFANSSNPDEFLPNLSDEATKISDLLNRLLFLDSIYFMKDEIFSVDRLHTNFSKYGDKYTHFYFSGHSKDGALKLSENIMPDAGMMAELLNSSLSNLEFAFFNACETYPLARTLVELRTQSVQKKNLVIIACGKEINAFLAEKFASLFFNHVGRPGTYLDAYRTAASSVRMLNKNLQFKEFRTPEEVLAADGNFEYAIIDFSPVMAKNAPKPKSVIETDKKTKDFLAANFLKEVTESAMLGELDAVQLAAVQVALEQTKRVVEGATINNKVKESWKTIEQIIPGIDSKNDFKSLVNVSKGAYDDSLDQIYGKAAEKPTVASMMPVEEPTH